MVNWEFPNHVSFWTVGGNQSTQTQAERTNSLKKNCEATVSEVSSHLAAPKWQWWDVTKNIYSRAYVQIQGTCTS